MPATFTSFSPLYQQIKDLLMTSLQSGEWKPGDLIPSEMDLAARFQVSQGTVRKAIDSLAADNLLTRRQGKGTYVASHQEINKEYRFLRLVSDANAPLVLQNQFLSCKSVKALSWIARALKIQTGDSVIQIERIQLAQGKPIVLEEIWLLSSRFKGISLDELNRWPTSLYAFFESEFSTHMVRAEEKIKAIEADLHVSSRLGISQGTALLQVERLSFTYGNKPVELRLAKYHTSQQHYANLLS
ncbi:MAG: GntR family transcriptional regulator [Polynucleobacter sp.]|nr:GntR family transcriptional regulator [Polynucleobacter sp.]